MDAHVLRRAADHAERVSAANEEGEVRLHIRPNGFVIEAKKDGRSFMHSLGFAAVWDADFNVFGEAINYSAERIGMKSVDL